MFERLRTFAAREPGTILIFFPEGRRSAGVAPGKFKPGVALLAAAATFPVVPCHLDGTHAALPKGAWCPRPKAVRLTIGTPRLYTHLLPTKESARQISHELREAVICLDTSSKIRDAEGVEGCIEERCVSCLRKSIEN